MKTSSQNRSLSPKISVKQMRLSPNTNYTSGFNYNYRNTSTNQYDEDQDNNHYTYTPYQIPKNNQNYRYPDNHIVSQRQVDCQGSGYFKQKQKLSETRQRRTRIFQKKTLKARVIPDQYDFQKPIRISRQRQEEFSKQKSHSRQIQQKMIQQPHRNTLSREEQFYTFKNIQVNKDQPRQQNIRKKEPSPRNFNQKNEQQLQFSPQTIRTLGNATSGMDRSSYNFRVYQSPNNFQFTNRSIQNNKSPEQNRKSGDNLANQKLPSFASNPNSPSVEAQSLKNRNIQLQTMIILTGIPEEVNRLKKEVMSQRKQLAQLDSKIQDNNKNHFRKQKELLDNLIGQHHQLTNKQYELNESLQKMSKIQAESGERYQKILKYELQMQRAQRIQNLCRQNQRLAQELLKNHSRDTADLTPLSHPLNMNSTKFHSSFHYHRPASPSHPTNNLNTNTHRYFREEYQKNWRQISALQAPHKCEQSYDNDNTLRQLLSPLEVKHEFDL